MQDRSDLADLYTHLARSGRLSEPEARRVVEEVLAFLDETPDAFVRRRHLELQSAGLGNAAIFARIERELAERRFRAPALSARQIRRIVYG